MKRWVLLFYLIIFGNSLATAQNVSWLSFESLSENLRQSPKPVLIFIHTNWCKYCALQQNSTFKNEEVVKVLNESFYCIEMDAESQEKITFLNRTYQPGSGNAYHELAILLGKENGQLNFPTTLIFSKQLELKSRMVGFTDTQLMITHLEKSF